MRTRNRSGTRTVRVSAPVRIADVGGWTDTWFAPRGAVCHLGVGPGVTVEATASDGPIGNRPVRIIAPDLGEDYRCGPDPHHGWAEPAPGRQPLLEHAVAAVLAGRPSVPDVAVHVHSAVPPGASLGTSASVLVALIGALDALVAAPGEMAVLSTDAARARLAARAHAVETERAGRQSGVQDHWAAAFGGAELLQIHSYPEVVRSPIEIGPRVLGALESRTVTVGLGAHDSSAVHAQVIGHLTDSDAAAASARAHLGDLATLATRAAAALRRDDVTGWSRTLTGATDIQARLHSELVGPAHHRLIATARDHGALGWKVNGAGGRGGSITVVFASPHGAGRFTDSIAANEPGATICALRPWGGARVEWVGPR